MTSRLPISLSMLLIAAPKLCAQLAPAEDFFNNGAQLYISNNIPQAKEQVEMGLKLYPDDEKLKKLEELLKQQNQQQQNQKDQQSKDQQKSQQQKSDSQKNEPQKESQDQQKQDEQKQAEQKKSDEEKKAEPQKVDKKDEQKGEGQPQAAGQMTPEEAKRLLDAQKGNEQFLQLKPQDKPRDPRRPVRDW